MVGMGSSAAAGGAQLRRPADALAWLAGRQADDAAAERLLDAIRSAGGCVPLGGSDGGVTHAAPPSSSSEGGDAFWALTRALCALPASAHPNLRAYDDDAVDGKAAASGFTWQRAAAIRASYFGERRAFFRVRVELLRLALYADSQVHPNADAVEETVDELLKDGLLDALLDEVAGRAKAVASRRPNFFALPTDAPGHVIHQQLAQQAWELQWLEEEALVRHLLLLALCYSREKVDASRALQTIQAIHVRRVLKLRAVVVMSYRSGS